MSFSHPRRGAVLVWFAFLLVVLLGFLGLVIDTGLLLASHRHAQNAADAAVLAAAHDLYHRGAAATPIVTGKDYACTYNGIANRDDVIVNVPPLAHPHRDDPNPDCFYTGNSGYVEAIVSQPQNTFFIHLLGANPTNTVTARAIAGYERRSAGEGVIVLDPYAYPGLTVQGGGVLSVNGRIIVNSEGEGVGLDELTREQVDVDMNGDGSITGYTPSAAVAVTDAENLRAVWLQVRGGVDVVENYLPYDPEETDSPLHTGQELAPDPLWDLATPTVNNGVDPTQRGIVAVTNQGVTGQSEPYIVDNRDPLVVDKITGDMGQNFIAAGGEVISDDLNGATGGHLNHVAVLDEVILYPGLYDKISIADGQVFFVPGIYVLTPKNQTTYALSIQGGDVSAEGVMFYNTANNYTASNGMPDAKDIPEYREDEKAPPGKKAGYVATEQELADLGDYAGGFNITSGMHLSPIDTGEFSNEGYNYANIYDSTPLDLTDQVTTPEVFNGMLFYQRRWNAAPVLIRGDEEGGSSMGGTLYAKWSQFDLAGSGIYDAQFVAGSMAIDGRANIRILSSGKRFGLATKIYLVE